MNNLERTNKLEQEFLKSLFNTTIVVKDYIHKFNKLATTTEFIEECKAEVLKQYTADKSLRDGMGRLALLCYFQDNLQSACVLWELDQAKKRSSWFQTNFYAVCIMRLKNIDEAKKIILDLYDKDHNARNGLSSLGFFLLDNNIDATTALELLYQDYHLGRMRPHMVFALGSILISQSKKKDGSKLILEACNNEHIIDFNQLPTLAKDSLETINYFLETHIDKNPDFATKFKEQYANYLYSEGKLNNAIKTMQEVFEYKYNDWKENNSWKYLERVNFEITSVCNLKCKYCTFANGLQEKYIEPKLFRRVLRELAVAPVHINQLALYMSGESLIHPNIIEIFEIVSQVKQEFPDFQPLTYLHTNGTLWKPKMHDKIMQTKALDRVVWSIDGIDKKTFEEMRPGAKYEKVLSNYEYFIANKENIEGWINNLVLPEHDQSMLDSRLLNAFYTADHLVQAPPRELNTDNLQATSWQGSNCGFCSYVFNTAVITTAGQLSLCCVDYNAENAFGDLNKNTFEVVYFGHKRKEILKLMSEQKRKKITGCKNCSVFHAGWFNNELLEDDN